MTPKFYIRLLLAYSILYYCTCLAVTHSSRSRTSLLAVPAVSLLFYIYIGWNVRVKPSALSRVGEGKFLGYSTDRGLEDQRTREDLS